MSKIKVTVRNTKLANELIEFWKNKDVNLEISVKENSTQVTSNLNDYEFLEKGIMQQVKSFGKVSDKKENTTAENGDANLMEFEQSTEIGKLGGTILDSIDEKDISKKEILKSAKSFEKANEHSEVGNDSDYARFDGVDDETFKKIHSAPHFGEFVTTIQSYPYLDKKIEDTYPKLKKALELKNISLPELDEFDELMENFKKTKLEIKFFQNYSQ